MITPNKFITLDRSVLAKLDIILDKQIDTMSIHDLYRVVANRFDTVDQFLLALDVLYILGCIDVDFKTATVSHAD